MAQFNKFPIRETADENGGNGVTVTGGNLLPPRLARAKYGDAAFAEQAQSNRYEGFAGDGDYVELPITAGGNIEYFNNSDVSQWTVARTDIAALADDWVGFIHDATDNLIYVMVVDEGTTNNTYYTASITALGAITNIGNAQPGSDFTTTTGTWWLTGADTTGGSLIQREADGSGNLFVRQTNTGGMEEMEINILTGAIVSDPTVIDSFLVDCCWKSASGIYYSVDSAASQKFVSETIGPFRISITSGSNFGWQTTAGNKAIQWKGRAVETSAASNGTQTNRFTNTISEQDAWIDLVATQYGIG